MLAVVRGRCIAKLSLQLVRVSLLLSSRCVCFAFLRRIYRRLEQKFKCPGRWNRSVVSKKAFFHVFCLVGQICLRRKCAFVNGRKFCGIGWRVRKTTRPTAASARIKNVFMGRKGNSNNKRRTKLKFPMLAGISISSLTASQKRNH